MTVVPDLLASSVLTAVLAVATGVIAIRFAGGRRGPIHVLGGSLLLLLVGGGMAPPVLGVLAALLASQIDRIPDRPVSLGTRALARLSPWPLAAAVIGFLALVPGTAMLYLIAGVNSGVLVTALIVLAFTGTILAMHTARAHDRVHA